MIGIINFSHSDPLYLAIENKSQVIRDTPANIFRMLENGKLDTGMISLVTYLENVEKFKLLKTANIHSLRTTMSTILVSRGVELHNGMQIAVTSHTRTTEFYLKAVLDGMKLDYNLIHTDKTEAKDLLDLADFALVIGDEAMSVYGTNMKITMDIGFEFSRIYSMSPVYAVTVSSSSNAQSAIELLDKAVENSAGYKEEAVRSNSDRFGLPESIFRRYYSMIRYNYNQGVSRTIDFVAEALVGRKTSV